MQYERKLKIEIILSYFKYSAFGFRPLSKLLIINNRTKYKKLVHFFYFCVENN